MTTLPPFFDPKSTPTNVAHLFSGTYAQSIDTSYRISIPRGIESVLTKVDRIVLWKSQHVDAIEGTTEAIFNSSVRLDNIPRVGIERIIALDSIYGNVYVVTLSSSRITIPRPLVSQVSFEKNVVIVGMGTFFHIWPAGNYEAFHKRPGKEPPA